MSTFLRQHFEKNIALTNEEFEYILSHFIEKKLDKHQFLIQEGDSVINSYFVVKGLLKTYHINQEGKEYILQFAMEDWWVSDFQAYFNHTSATLNIYSLEAVELLGISQKNQEKICAEFHKLDYFFRHKTNFGYVALQNRILSLLNNSAKERYEQLLLQSPQLLQRVPKAQIASYLGVSRETLSRLS